MVRVECIVINLNILERLLFPHKFVVKISSEFLFAVWASRSFDEPAGDTLLVEHMEATKDSTFLMILDRI
jgi:hypothetical protein